MRIGSGRMSSSDPMSLGPTLEEFASKHRLPPRWLELRKACDRLVSQSDFWYRRDLRDQARQLAVEASDIFHFLDKRSGQRAPGGILQACPQDINEAIGSDCESADRERGNEVGF